MKILKSFRLRFCNFEANSNLSMYLSKHIESAVNEFSKLPGVGKKTAFRYVLHLMESSGENIEKLAQSIEAIKNNVLKCNVCHVPNDSETCIICANKGRDTTKICVVENLKDLLAIENTNQFQGVYHVLDGIISPIDGIGPDDLNIDTLEERIKQHENVELIMALNPTIEGDTTIFYLSNRFKNYNISITTISRGIAFGGELDYTDQLTLGRSLQARQPYDLLISK
jgi:recombination protein RecR